VEVDLASRGHEDDLVDTHPVTVGVPALRAGHTRRIGILDARIASVADQIAVRVRLGRIEGFRTVVGRADVAGEPRVAGGVAVGVRARVANVADQIGIRILLPRVDDRRAVVRRARVVRIARVPCPVAIGIGAEIARIACTVAIAVGLPRIEYRRAVVDRGTVPVTVDVVLGLGRADVAHVADAVVVAVELGRVRLVGTVVLEAHVRGETGIAEAVPIRVGARVAGVSAPVAVEVRLARIGGRRAVVARITDAVEVAVLLGRVRLQGTVVVDIDDAVSIRVDFLLGAGRVVGPLSSGRVRP
jgi:hypothetical protein